MYEESRFVWVVDLFWVFFVFVSSLVVLFSFYVQGVVFGVLYIVLELFFDMLSRYQVGLLVSQGGFNISVLNGSVKFLEVKMFVWGVFRFYIQLLEGFFLEWVLQRELRRLFLVFVFQVINVVYLGFFSIVFRSEIRQVYVEIIIWFQFQKCLIFFCGFDVVYYLEN